MKPERKPRPAAVRACAEWLSYCLSIGWSKADLDALEHMWWEYHDDHGCLITTHDKCKYETVTA